MMDLNDPRWNDLPMAGSDRPRVAQLIRDLECATDPAKVSAAWSALWDGLHHQGAVTVGSYAAVPHLVRICRENKARLGWDLFALVALIEECRHVTKNPPMPPEFAEAYCGAIRTMFDFVREAADDDWSELQTQAAAGWLATVKGHRRLGEVILELGPSALDWFEKEYWGEKA
jgi:hypothetical protein